MAPSYLGGWEDLLNSAIRTAHSEAPTHCIVGGAGSDVDTPWNLGSHGRLSHYVVIFISTC